ncbi:protein TraP [Escherichia coli M605]|uniref:Protein TraP n=1 Tax=Escherichia coli M605 TaxID=656417 RepID=F4STW7_ECOLX|nr:protein TraP [Escherichia coli M605]
MANNMSSRQAFPAARYVVARVLSGVFWCLKYAVILPLATIALMALFVLWKDNTTPGKLLVQEIEYVRDRTPAGLYPIRYCPDNSDTDLAMPSSAACGFRRGDAAEYVRETDRSLMQLVTALWATLALMYMSFAVGTGKKRCCPEK